ncbi:type IV secretory system conjugative DNA transfer family protein [Candidatus Tisiphia endosymbiont of Hybos culiciformis]|uniref:type IV secretory system conjugative DNA transfer family protein n=1 Tax=Candidatus Tisiphia endosymbiont of Hybos culiciformis TaxID=3139331 RepID=UPI003CCB08C8
MSSENAILLGKSDNGKPLYAEGYQHILLLAPQGSGKGVCFVLPALLTYSESCVVHDIKLENYELTSGYRESIGHKIFVFNPLSCKNKTHRYNPLDFINLDSEEIINDIQKIADLLIKDNASSKSLFTGLVLYLCYDTTKTRSLGEIARMLQRNLVQELSDGINKAKGTIHEYGFEILSSFLSKTGKEQNFLIRELSHYLYPWTNPLIDYATSKSDFDIADLKISKMTLYVGVNPADINRLQPVLQLFYNHMADRLINAAQNLGNTEKNAGVCLLMDEFYSVGTLEMFTSCLPYFRGYKIKLFLISSNIGKIEEVYGENETKNIISDCTFKIAFRANDYKTANLISELCQDREKNTELLSREQVMNLPVDSQVILMGKEQPVISKKVFYYDDEKMKKKIIAPVML